MSKERKIIKNKDDLGGLVEGDFVKVLISCSKGTLDDEDVFEEGTFSEKGDGTFCVRQEIDGKKEIVEYEIDLEGEGALIVASYPICGNGSRDDQGYRL
jgi:hypothetical protein|tara:strand:+ start:7494 stop:7790 length:297 start_codon:yes stop_codon:yes gene_type:complete